MVMLIISDSHFIQAIVSLDIKQVVSEALASHVQVSFIQIISNIRGIRVSIIKLDEIMLVDIEAYVFTL